MIRPTINNDTLGRLSPNCPALSFALSLIILYGVQYSVISYYTYTTQADAAHTHPSSSHMSLPNPVSSVVLLPAGCWVTPTNLRTPTRHSCAQRTPMQCKTLQHILLAMTAHELLASKFCCAADACQSANNSTKGPKPKGTSCRKPDRATVVQAEVWINETKGKPTLHQTGLAFARSILQQLQNQNEFV